MKIKHTFPAMILLAGALLPSCGKDYTDTGIEYAPQMYHTIALEPYTQQADSFAPFTDSMNVQPFPAGSIPRGGWADYPWTLTSTDSGYMQLQNPLESSPELLADAKVLYERFCGVCHGKEGGADSGPVAKFSDVINPPALTEDRIKKFTPGQLYHTIMVGKGVMGSYASQITYKDRWMIVHYVREMQGLNKVAETPAAPADSAAAAEVKPEPSRGKTPPPSHDLIKPAPKHN